MTEDKAKNRTADEGETTPTPQSSQAGASQAGASRAPHEAAAHEVAPGAAPPPEAEAGPGEAGPGEAGPGEAGPGEAILEEAVLEAAGPGETSLEDAGLPSQDEIAHLKDQILRALAETENLRRRAERERDEVAKYAVSGFARDILTVADNLRRALDAIPEDAREKDELLNNLAVGVEATERELMAAFERHGIRKIEPLGEKFNHDFHQAMFEVENTGKPPGTVVQLLQAGYVVHDRLLRPAMVGVAKGEPEARKVDTEA